MVDQRRALTAGLSPRVRGNQILCGHCFEQVGSIPACAGEPSSRRRTRGPGLVYPRVCGGTKICPRTNLAWGGLSPRVRGNRQSARRLLVRGRSIPACAGEPSFLVIMSHSFAVYPRVCGNRSRG